MKESNLDALVEFLWVKYQHRSVTTDVFLWRSIRVTTARTWVFTGNLPYAVKCRKFAASTGKVHSFKIQGIKLKLDLDVAVTIWLWSKFWVVLHSSYGLSYWVILKTLSHVFLHAIGIGSIRGLCLAILLEYLLLYWCYTNARKKEKRKKNWENLIAWRRISVPLYIRVKQIWEWATLILYQRKDNTVPQIVYLYRPQRSCGQGYVFTRVCDSVHRGGSPGRGNPPGQGESPREQTPQQGEPPPGSRPPPRKHTPAYGQRVAGTHPTGMHSCYRVVNPPVLCAGRTFWTESKFSASSPREKRDHALYISKGDTALVTFKFLLGTWAYTEIKKIKMHGI